MSTASPTEAAPTGREHDCGLVRLPAEMAWVAAIPRAGAGRVTASATTPAALAALGDALSARGVTVLGVAGAAPTGSWLDLLVPRDLFAHDDWRALVARPGARMLQPQFGPVALLMADVLALHDPDRSRVR